MPKDEYTFTPKCTRIRQKAKLGKKKQLEEARFCLLGYCLGKPLEAENLK
jgi:hypothetical protein